MKPGIGANVKKHLWDEAEMFPACGAAACLSIEDDRRRLRVLLA